MIRKSYITLILILFVHVFAHAQDENKANSLFKTAKKNYQDLKFLPAIKAFEIVLKDHPEYTNAAEMLADSYRNVLDYTNAVKWYEKLAGTPNYNLKAEQTLKFAQVLANTEQYKKSGEWYRKYADLKGNDKTALAFADLYDNLGQLYARSTEWQVEYLNINTLASEFSPMFYKNGLMFTSNRKGKSLSSSVFEWDETPFTNLYYIENRDDIKGINLDSIRLALRKQYQNSGKKLYRENDDDTYTTSNDSKIVGMYIIKMLKDTVGDYLSTLINVKEAPGRINSKYHDGPSAMLPGEDIIFNRNNYFDGKYSKSNEGINKLKLFTAKAPDYTDIIPYPYNNDEYSVGHPTVSSDGKLLIFASDKPGGKGKSDLYYSKRESANDAWGKPVNLGSVINTEGDEQFPTLYQDSVLYFSSNGHPGLGGLDIFKVTLNGTSPINKPANVGVPINSSVDDFGLIKDDNGLSGYFTSNRKGSDDIYRFKFKPYQIKFKGLVVDAANGKPVEGVMVAVLPEGKRYFQTDVSGSISRILSKDLDYTISAAKNGFSGSETIVSTKNITSDTVLTVTLKIKTVQTAGVSLAQSFPCDSLAKIASIKKIYYDLDKSLIRNDAQPELDKLASLLKSSKQMKVVVASYCDERASVKYNLTLSKKRSTGAKEYLLAHGVSSDRIIMEYFGKSNLFYKCDDKTPCTEAEHQLNRRTEFTLVINGKELQTADCDFLKRSL